MDDVVHLLQPAVDRNFDSAPDEWLDMIELDVKLDLLRS